MLAVLLRSLLQGDERSSDAPDEAFAAEVAVPAGSTRRARGAGWRQGTAAVLSLTLPVAALAVYLEVGDPRAAAEANTEGGATHATQGVDVEAMVEGLAARLQASPEDLQGWMVLARSREVQERYAEAATAYRRAIALATTPDQTLLRAKLQADLADTLGSQQQGDLGGPALAAIGAALALDPDQPKALALAGAAAVRQGDLALARRHWTRLQGLLEPGSDMAQRVGADLARLAEDAPPASARPAAPAPAATSTSWSASAARASTATWTLSSSSRTSSAARWTWSPSKR